MDDQMDNSKDQQRESFKYIYILNSQDDKMKLEIFSLGQVVLQGNGPPELMTHQLSPKMNSWRAKMTSQKS